jgi:hypothetical protein
MKNVKVERFTLSPQVFVEYLPKYNDVVVTLNIILSPKMDGNFVFQTLEGGGFNFQNSVEGKVCYTTRVEDISLKTRKNKQVFFKALVFPHLKKEIKYSVSFDKTKN